MTSSLKLFTPGPSNTSEQVKAVMNQDIGSRTSELNELTRSLRTELLYIASCSEEEFSAIPLQGSGTYAVEAMLTSLINENDKLLVIINGPYGERIADICRIYKLSTVLLYTNYYMPIPLKDIKNSLENDLSINKIAIVHFETGLGILNDLEGLLLLAKNYNCRVLVDAMSSFGILDIHINNESVIAVASSMNKALHGVPGLSFVIVRNTYLYKQIPQRTLCLDIKSQQIKFIKTGEWRFTPPTHVILAAVEAIKEYIEQGGQYQRLLSYTKISNIVLDGLEKIGFQLLINKKYIAPIVHTFIIPFDKKILDFQKLSKKLKLQGFIIYDVSQNIGEKNIFKLGYIGCLCEKDAYNLVNAIANEVTLLKKTNE